MSVLGFGSPRSHATKGKHVALNGIFSHLYAVASSVRPAGRPIAPAQELQANIGFG